MFSVCVHGKGQTILGESLSDLYLEDEAGSSPPPPVDGFMLEIMLFCLPKFGV
jgi:hypothetical protein